MTFSFYRGLQETEVTLLLVLLRAESSSGNSSFGLKLRATFTAGLTGVGVADSEDVLGLTGVDERVDLDAGATGIAEREGFFGVVGFGLRSAANTTAWHQPPSGPHCSARKAWISS